MRINPISTQVYHYSDRITNINKKRVNPSFGADFDNKPVPPAGKIISAAALVALITAMISTANCGGDSSEEQNSGEPIEYRDSNTYNDFYVSDNKNQKEENISEKTSKDENRIIETADTADIDTVSVDSIKHKHIIDTAHKEPAELIGHFNGTPYKVVAKGDTVILVPVSHNTKSENVDTMAVSKH